jgi:hypothetical protein
MSDKKDEIISALEARVAALEAKDKPPKPFKDEPYQRYDPTAGMSMPRSALEAMIAAEPRGFMRGVVADNRAPTSPGTIPRSEQPSNVRTGNVPGSGTGWAHETKLGPQPGIDLIDRGVNAALPHGPEWGKKRKR